jgi:DNA-directed RNA polymerase subunit RPC12/RpoP
MEDGKGWEKAEERIEMNPLKCPGCGHLMFVTDDEWERLTEKPGYYICSTCSRRCWIVFGCLVVTDERSGLK